MCTRTHVWDVTFGWYRILYFTIFSTTNFNCQIKLYASSKYSDDKINLLSRFFLQTHNREQPDDDDSDYSIIEVLYISIIPFQTILMPLFGLLGGWIVSIIEEAVEKFSKHDKDTKKHFHLFIVYGCGSRIIMLFFFVIFYILAMVKLIKYSQETFNSIAIGVVGIVFSSLTIAVAMPSLVYILWKHEWDNKDKSHYCISKPFDYFITVITFMYLGYFFPYMVIAFIANPLKTVFTYAIFFFLVIFFYIIQIVWLLKAKMKISGKKKVAFAVTIFLGIPAIPYFLIALIAVFSLGSFNDFDDLKNITLPLISSLIVSLMGVAVYYIRTFSKLQSKTEQNPATGSQPQNPATDSQPQNPATDSQPQNPATDSQPQNPATDSQPQNPATDSQPQNPATDSQPQNPATDSQSQNPATDSQPQNPATDSQPQNPATTNSLNKLHATNLKQSIPKNQRRRILSAVV